MSSQDSDGSKNNSRVNSESNEVMGKGDGKVVLHNHTAQLYKVLPPQIRRRIKALKKLQVEAVNIEADFYIELHKLECKYSELYSTLYAQRKEIVTGEKEPTDEECDFKLDPLLDADANNEESGFSPYGPVDLNSKGIPYFWLTIFRNVDVLNDMVQPYDEPVLKHLIDISVQFLEHDPMGFVLVFKFSPNEYFSNTMLTKHYEMSCKPDEKDPFSFEGPEIVKCWGCTIDWYKNKCVTLKSVRKRQKHKNHGAMRTVTQQVKCDSFFNFFDPPPVPEDNSEVDQDTEAILTSDFEIGHYIRERIVPHAVLYFTGEALEEEEDMEEEEDEDEDEITDDSDENETVVSKKEGKKALQQPPEGQQVPPECKPQ